MEDRAADGFEDSTKIVPIEPKDRDGPKDNDEPKDRKAAR